MKKQTERVAGAIKLKQSVDMASASRFVFSSALANPQHDMANGKAAQSLVFCGLQGKQFRKRWIVLRCGGIRHIGFGLGEVAEPKSQIEVQMFKIKNEC